MGVAHLHRTNRFTRKLFISSIYCLIYDTVIYTVKTAAPIRTPSQRLLHVFPLSGDSTLRFFHSKLPPEKNAVSTKNLFLYEKNPNFCNDFY